MQTNLTKAISRLLRPNLSKPHLTIRFNQSSTVVPAHDRPTDGLLDPFSSVKENNDKKISIFLKELEPPPKKGYNFAAYVNSSETLQKLVKLGVSLYDIENTNKTAAQQLLKLDFHRDCLPYIKFLVDNGLKDRNLGRFISEYSELF